MSNGEVASMIASPAVPPTLKTKLAVIALVPALLLLDLGIAVARGWKLCRSDFSVVTAASLILLSLVLTAASRRGRSFLQNHGDSIAYLSMSALGAWLVAEVIVAAYVYFAWGVDPFTSLQPFHTRFPGKRWILTPDSASLPGIFGVSHYTTNSLGLRGPELPPREAAYRILTVGGSTTECLYLDDTETWQHLLMERLNQQRGSRRKVWIASAGISGYPTVNHLRFIGESPIVKKVDALVFLIGANDFNQFLRGKLQDGVFRPEETSPPVAVRPIWRCSPILLMVYTRWQRRTAAIAEDFQGKNIIFRRLKRQSATIRSSLPDLDKALRQYESRVEAIVRLARSFELRPVFVTQPTLWDKDLGEHAKSLLWLGDISKHEYLSAEAGRAGIDRHNDALMHVCEKLSVECISTSSMNAQEQYYYDDFHYNEAGAAELARIIADHLISHASADDWAPHVDAPRPPVQ
jgi:lysophospholipase L1-like esterase